MRIITSVAAVLLLTSIAQANDTASLRVRFGMKDTEARDWSGKLTPSKGSIESIRGWRWMADDKAEGGSFTISTRRGQPQTRADRLRIAAGGKMPLQENGFIATLTGVDADTQVAFETEPAKATLKLSDVPFGRPHIAADGNLIIERIPSASEIAGTSADEDYPTVARGKDGALYVAYLAFTRGKDFTGPRERPATPESGPNTGPLATGPVRKIEKPEDFDYLAQPAGGEQIFLHVRSADGAWGEPIAVTDGKQELYRPAIAIDGDGHAWVFYSAHVDADENLDHGNWELMARSFDANGQAAGDAINISNAPGTDFMPAAATQANGQVAVVWVGARDKHFNVFISHQDGKKFDQPMRVTKSNANEWEPAIAANPKGGLAIAWDTYEKGDYDVMLAQEVRAGSLVIFNPQPVAATLAFEVRPSLAIDKDNRLWIAWEESGDHWGKDWGALKKEGIALYQTGRSVRVQALDADGKWLDAPDVMDAMPTDAPRRGRGGAARQPAGAEGSIAPSFPRLASDAKGNIWLAFRGKPGSNWRTPAGSVWFEYVTRVDGDAWTDAVWVPHSNSTLDNRPAVVGDDQGITVVYSGDGRGETGTEASAKAQATDETAPARRARRRGNIADINADLFTASLTIADFADEAKAPTLSPADAPAVVAPSNDATAERDAVKAIQDYRIKINGETLRIWRGEFHRHTELSPDGGNDGALLDMWRYGIDAADLDWIGDGDHDYGSGREYSWWTTQKLVTLFTIPKEFVPVYAYERSVSYPEGHRNVMFARRGIRSLPRLPITSPDKEVSAPDTVMLYRYLHHFDGLCASHTSATDMGTDWRDNDPVVEPFVEIYQGDRNNYERPDSPRSAVVEAKLKQSTPEKESLGGWQPKGFVNLALKRGYRLAFQASSDHISTHLSYCNVLIPADQEPTRASVLDAVKKRRVYGATDNIVADVRCKVGDVEHLMGEEFSTTEAPTLSIRFIGSHPIAKVTIIKDDEEVHVAEPNKQDVSLTWTDPNPTSGKTSYYYVRGEQVVDMEGATSGELVWASPMWIKYEPK